MNFWSDALVRRAGGMPQRRGHDLGEKALAATLHAQEQDAARRIEAELPPGVVKPPRRRFSHRLRFA